MDLDKLKDPMDFSTTMAQIAAATATSHTRGTASWPPGDFKRVIHALLGNKSKRKAWGQAVARFAHAYREQLLLDFDCFKEFVDTGAWHHEAPLR